jgi:hypothetical protein
MIVPGNRIQEIKEDLMVDNKSGMISKAELQSLLEKEGAITASSLLRAFPSLPPHKVRQVLLKHIAAGNLVWIPPLPRQAVFFTDPSNEKRFGLHLRRKLRTEGDGSSKKTKQHVLEALINDSPLKIDDLAEQAGVGRDTILRCLKALEKEGLVTSEIAASNGKKGRRPMLWSSTDKTSSSSRAPSSWPETVEVDFSKAADGPKGTRRRSKPKARGRGEVPKAVTLKPKPSRSTKTKVVVDFSEDE